MSTSMSMSNDAMSHEQAVRSQAVERYVLGELTPEERQAFEGHYFDCSACFEQVKLGAQFLHHAREVLDPEPEKGWLARILGDLRRPAPAFATAMLVCAIAIGAYQQVQIVDAKRPSIEARFTLTEARSGGSGTLSVGRSNRLSLTLDFNPKPEFTSYQAQIVAGSGKVKFSLPVQVAADQYSVTISLPANALEAGKYSMVLYGLTADGGKREIRREDFDLQFSN